MSAYDIPTLESMATDLESDLVERKESLGGDAKTKIREAVCAVANDPGVQDYRNPSLAEALRVLGFVQRFGSGIALARRALEENGNPPPEFSVNASHVSVSLKPA